MSDDKDPEGTAEELAADLALMDSVANAFTRAASDFETTPLDDLRALFDAGYLPVMRWEYKGGVGKERLPHVCTKDEAVKNAHAWAAGEDS